MFIYESFCYLVYVSLSILFLRNSIHLAKLVDAMHILNNTRISERKRRKANTLLQSFVDEFEDLYGEMNMVYNVHQLKHLTECVTRNGPLFTYSNYSMEDFMGHLVRFVRAPTDVSAQVSSRYILEKNLQSHLQKSEKARNFYDKIESRLFFSNVRKVNETLVIGKAKQTSNLTTQELEFIKQHFEGTDDDMQMSEYSAIFLNDQMYYETSSNSSRKRTDDSFLFNDENKEYAEIRSILVIDNNVYLLVNEKFAKIADKHCKYVQFLEESVTRLNLIEPQSISKKLAFVKFGNTISVSKFPNLYERN